MNKEQFYNEQINNLSCMCNIIMKLIQGCIVYCIFFFMPLRLLVGRHIVLSLSVHPFVTPHLVCIVCLANSSYSF